MKINLLNIDLEELIYLTIIIVSIVLMIRWFKLPLKKTEEIDAKKYLKSRLSEKGFQILSDVSIPDGKGADVKIDYILLSKYGVFLIKIDRPKGKVRVKQYMSNSNVKKQNYSDDLWSDSSALLLSSLTGFPPEKFTEVLVLRGNCELVHREQFPENILIGISELVVFLQTKRDVIFNKSQIQHISNRIAGKPDPISPKHLKKQEVSKIPDTPVCPNCGSPMERKIYNDLPFWGCSQYRKTKCNGWIYISSTHVYAGTIEEGSHLVEVPQCPKCKGLMAKRQESTGELAGKWIWKCRRAPECDGILKIIEL